MLFRMPTAAIYDDAGVVCVGQISLLLTPHVEQLGDCWGRPFRQRAAYGCPDEAEKDNFYEMNY